MNRRKQNIYLCKFKKWEILLLVLSAAAVLWCACLSLEQNKLADKLLRLHVVAASDSEADQAVKLQVRDAVLARAGDWLSGARDASEAEDILSEHLEELAQAGCAVLAEDGCPQAVTVSLERCWFPTRDYGTFALPAGEYRALRVVIGPGEGHNWWCVVFPSLCVSAASDWREAAAAGGLGENETALLAQEEGVELRFKCLEWLGELERWLGD